MDLKEWLEAVRRYPLKMKFQGFRGYWESIGDAAAHDERYMNEIIDGFVENEEEYLKEDIENFRKNPGHDKASILEVYIERLRKEYDLDEEDYTDLEVLDECDDKDSIRSLFCWEWVSEDADAYHYVRSKDTAEYLMNEHPVEEILSHSYEHGIDIDKVLFICPSCHREPQDADEINLTDNDWYCGMCGASSNLGPEEDMIDFFISLGIDVYPFDKKKQAEYMKLQAKREKEGRR